MRVYLRRPEIGDSKEFIAATKASVSLHRPWVFPVQDTRGFEEYLRRIQNPRYQGFFVCRSGDDRLVGVINLSEIIRDALQSAFVGYWGVEGLCGHGLMTEGLALVFDHAFDRLKLNRLEVNIQPKNLRSIELVKRLGLRREGFSPAYLKINGVWRDHERWAILAREWEGAESYVAEIAAAVLSKTREEIK